MVITFDSLAAQDTGTVGDLLPVYPAGAASGKLALLMVVNKPETAIPDHPVDSNTGAVWILIGTGIGGTGVQGADTGLTRHTLYARIERGGETGTVNCNIPGANTACARIGTLTKGANELWDLSFIYTNGTDATNNTSWAPSSGADIRLGTGDWCWFLRSTNTDSTGTPSATSLTATGATIGTPVQRAIQGTTVGNDIGYEWLDAPVTAGESTAAPVWTETDSINKNGSAGFVRIRVIPDQAYIPTLIRPGRGPTSLMQFVEFPGHTELTVMTDSSAVAISGFISTGASERVAPSTGTSTVALSVTGVSAHVTTSMGSSVVAVTDASSGTHVVSANGIGIISLSSVATGEFIVPAVGAIHFGLVSTGAGSSFAASSGVGLGIFGLISNGSSSLNLLSSGIGVLGLTNLWIITQLLQPFPSICLVWMEKDAIPWTEGSYILWIENRQSDIDFQEKL